MPLSSRFQIPIFCRTRAGLTLGALALLLAGLAPRPARAAPDPRQVFSTLETPHFRVHFPDGAYRRALAAARRLELAHTLLVPLLAHAPRRRTEVLLSDQSDDANGLATSFPYPLIEARLAPPGARSILGHYDDFLWTLLVHEYVHVLHLDHTEGLPDLGNRIFGRLFSPNGFQPSWMVEGLATRYETLLSGQGRNASPRVDMILRAQVLESGALWKAGGLSAAPTAWPGATLWYLYGGRVWEQIARTAGESAPGKMSTEFGGRVLPFAYNLSAENATGTSLDAFYEGWRETETARHQETLERIEAAGVIEGEQLTHLGRVVSDPRPQSGGQVFFRASDGERFPGVFVLDLGRPGEAPRRVRRQAGLDTFAVAPHAESLLLAARERHETYQFTGDLFAVPVGAPPGVRSEGLPSLSAPGRRLSAGLRVTHVAISPRGDRVALIAQRRGAQALYLATLHLPPRAGPETPVARLGPLRRVLALPETQLDKPAFCPSGEHLALAFHPSGGTWDLAIVSLPRAAELDAHDPLPPRPDEGSGGAARMQVVAHGPGDTLDPAFSPDHRRLVFSAERDGVFDLFTLLLTPDGDGATAAPPRRLTRVRTGAFEPRFTPEGSAIVYVGYSAEGYDLFRLAFNADGLNEATKSTPAATSPHARTWPRSALVARGALYPMHPYRPLSTLRPHYFIPTMGTDATGLTVGVLSGGSDIVGRHAWGGSAWMGVRSRAPGYAISYRYTALLPSLEVRSSTFLTLAASGPRPGGRLLFPQRVSSLSVALGADDAHVDRFQGVNLALKLRRLSVKASAPGAEAGEAPLRFPQSAWLNEVTASWTATDVHGFAESISAEEGLRVTLQATLASRYLGSAGDRLDLTLYLFGYRPMPFARGHVLAFRLRAAASLGRVGGRAAYTLGGAGLSDPFRSAFEGSGLPGTLLRGHPVGAFAGDALLATNTEYRFPLWEVDRGEGLLPFFLRRISGAAFLDLGTAGDLPDLLLRRTFGVGVGAELRAELTVGYLLPLQVRLGIARGLTAGGLTQPFAGLGGVF